MLTEVEIRALVRAEHRDPFAVLGAHAGADGLWVRALLPGAASVEVLDEDDAVAGVLAQIDEDGLFEARLDPRPLPWAYRLRVCDLQGCARILDDPYRFPSTIGEFDRHLLGEGSHLRPWQIYGAHLREQDGVCGVRFAVWAPDAARVAVIGEFNGWDGRCHGMRLHPDVGVWEIFVPGVEVGALYKYEIHDRDGHLIPAKADPYAFATQLRPDTASVVAVLPSPPAPAPDRGRANQRDQPISIYEVHLGSWRRPPDGGFPSWDMLAEQLPAYAADLGFTHLELLPIAEHPFDGSWGYQVTGMYAPTRRFGPPEGLARFLAACREHGLGVILDWVPAHFPNDAHGLSRFDGRPCYEYADPREGLHRDWDTLIYDFGRAGVRNFLVGSALYWLERWGVDGLRVDAVASMLYRDYSRAEGEWVPNVHGGRENLEAIALLRRVNEVVGDQAPGRITIAEESTAWPGVSRPTSAGGLGFHYKWNMGWMHDSLAYMGLDPIHRKHHHDKLSFGLVYAFCENFVLPLSHDEVVHGKGALIAKMSGDRWQAFASLRAYYGFMWTHPGKKLLFMGGELASEREWNHDRELDWELLDEGREGSGAHRGVQALVRDLNRLYRELPALHRLDCVAEGFEWLVVDDRDQSVFAFLRKDGEGGEVLVACNFTPVPRTGYRIGLPTAGRWVERLNTDSERHGGSGMTNGAAAIASEAIAAHGREHSVALTLPPLATLILDVSN